LKEVHDITIKQKTLGYYELSRAFVV